LEKLAGTVVTSYAQEPPPGPTPGGGSLFRDYRAQNPSPRAVDYLLEHPRPDIAGAFLLPAYPAYRRQAQAGR